MKSNQVTSEKQQVVIRIKPNLQKNIDNEILSGFDYIFGKDSTQEDIYINSVQPLVRSAIKGSNFTLYFYGENNSGKTYTSGLNDVFSASVLGEYFHIEKHTGVILRLLNEVLKFYYDSKIDYKKVLFSILEIKNEQLIDVLDDSNHIIKIEEICNSIYYTNLTEYEFQDVAIFNNVLKKCKMNLKSNIMFNIFIEKNTSGVITRNRICIAKLASSNKDFYFESNSKKNNNLAGFQSILAFNTVISNLSKNDSFVPFKISKLTFALKDLLAGNNQSLFVACFIQDNQLNSQATLEIANCAKKIKNRISENTSNYDGLAKVNILVCKNFTFLAGL